MADKLYVETQLVEQLNRLIEYYPTAFYTLAIAFKESKYSYYQLQRDQINDAVILQKHYFATITSGSPEGTQYLSIHPAVVMVLKKYLRGRKAALYLEG